MRSAYVGYCRCRCSQALSPQPWSFLADCRKAITSIILNFHSNLTYKRNWRPIPNIQTRAGAIMLVSATECLAKSSEYQYTVKLFIINQWSQQITVSGIQNLKSIRFHLSSFWFWPSCSVAEQGFVKGGIKWIVECVENLKPRPLNYACLREMQSLATVNTDFSSSL